MNGQAFTALKGATNALKNVHKELDVDSVQDIMDELAEQHELSNEIANAISSPVGMNRFCFFLLRLNIILYRFWC